MPKTLTQDDMPSGINFVRLHSSDRLYVRLSDVSKLYGIKSIALKALIMKLQQTHEVDIRMVNNIYLVNLPSFATAFAQTHPKVNFASFEL